MLPLSEQFYNRAPRSGVRAADPLSGTAIRRRAAICSAVISRCVVMAVTAARASASTAPKRPAKSTIRTVQYSPPRGAQVRVRTLWCIVWCMKRTNIYLDEEQTAALDRLATQEGVSRAEVIRQLLDRVLASSDESLASDLDAIEHSFGALRDVDVPVRGPGGREQHLARCWGRSS